MYHGSEGEAGRALTHSRQKNVNTITETVLTNMLVSMTFLFVEESIFPRQSPPAPFWQLKCIMTTFFWPPPPKFSMVWVHLREYWMIYRGPGFLVVEWFGSSPTTPPPPPSRQQLLSLSSVFLCVACRDNRSYDYEKAWPSITIQHTLCSPDHLHFLYFYM